MKKLASALARSKGSDEREDASQLFGRPSPSLMRGTALMLASRSPDDLMLISKGQKLTVLSEYHMFSDLEYLTVIRISETILISYCYLHLLSIHLGSQGISPQSCTETDFEMKTSNFVLFLLISAVSVHFRAIYDETIRCQT